jgi:hypothetical protein
MDCCEEIIDEYDEVEVIVFEIPPITEERLPPHKIELLVPPIITEPSTGFALFVPLINKQEPKATAELFEKHTQEFLVLMMAALELHHMKFVVPFTIVAFIELHNVFEEPANIADQSDTPGILLLLPPIIKDLGEPQIQLTNDDIIEL